MEIKYIKKLNKKILNSKKIKIIELINIFCLIIINLINKILLLKPY
jgi:hypothetical protein